MADPEVEERRRAIEVVLERRPEVDLQELGEIMAELGTPVDEATLVSDLDALGFEVADTDDAEGAGVAGADARPATPPEPSPAADGPSFRRPEGAAPAATDAFDAGSGGGGGFDLRRLNPTVLVAAGVLVVALVVAAVLIIGGDDGGDDVSSGGATTTTGAGGEDGGEPGTTAEPKIATRGDGSDPALAVEGTILDDFEREGPDMGELPGVGPWEVLAGQWTLADGKVSGSGAEAEPGNLVVVDGGPGDVRMQVEVVGRTNGSGIAFRVADADNYFAWVTAPYYGTIGLVEVVDGERRTLFDAGLAVTEDGMPAMGIHLTGNRVELLFDGAVTATYDELPDAEGRERVGLTMARGDETAVFDDVRLLSS